MYVIDIKHRISNVVSSLTNSGTNPTNLNIAIWALKNIANELNSPKMEAAEAHETIIDRKELDRLNAAEQTLYSIATLLYSGDLTTTDEMRDMYETFYRTYDQKDD